MNTWTQAFVDICHYARLLAMAKIDYMFATSASASRRAEWRMGKTRASLQCAIAVYKTEVLKRV